MYTNNSELAQVYAALHQHEPFIGLIKARIERCSFDISTYFYKHEGTLRGIGVPGLRKTVKRALEEILDEEATRDMERALAMGLEAPDLKTVYDLCRN